MKRITKAQRAKLASLVTELQGKQDDLTAALEKCANAIEEAWAGVERARDDCRNVGNALNEELEGICADMEAYASERSEKWPESEGGQRYQDWMQQWQDARVDLDLFEGLDSDKPETPGTPDV